jgi:LysR family transcriptional regulator, glycine cleavage system transcriptional activator
MEAATPVEACDRTQDSPVAAFRKVAAMLTEARAHSRSRRLRTGPDEDGNFGHMRDINLKAMEYFEAVARLGRVSRAATELGVSPSAVSQQIRQIEAQFGVKLFRREKQRLVLTLDGDRLFHTTNQAFRAIRNARSAITRQREARNLTIRVSPSFGTRWLGPRLGDFIAENPEWRLRVDATPDFTEFETEAVDLDLRYGLGGWPGLRSDCIMNDLVLPVASPAYAAELRTDAAAVHDQLCKARLIDSVKMLYRWDIWLAGNGIEVPELDYPARFDRSSMSIELAKQGGGIALESVTLCLPELKRGELVPFAPEYAIVQFPAYWFVCPPRHYSRRIVQRFADWIQRACRKHEEDARDYLAGVGCRLSAEEGAGLISAVWETGSAPQ